jgi:hypothetical protein
MKGANGNMLSLYHSSLISLFTPASSLARLFLRHCLAHAYVQLK